ncbi:hypothetical protein BOQ63_000455 (plasmid) [Streptomyces viridifaciens]|nr:hypothetical protein BOQ63_000455 [Streptomyces viridifaciens]
MSDDKTTFDTSDNLPAVSTPAAPLVMVRDEGWKVCELMRLSNDTIEITELPGGAGFVWEATGVDGTPGASEEPHGSWADAAQDASVFLEQHGQDPHAECYQPHRNSQGEHVDCDGTPL